MDIDSLLSVALKIIPSSYLATATAIISFIIAACALAVRFWKPPAKNSRWLGFYRIVSALAQARGWNANAYQPDRKAIMVPSSQDRSEVAENLGLKIDETRP
ncbi:hypothetical protein [Acetobacter conturbans]|uniref:Uncharacterized protein n=1 Tax=Acetobacter conturbans TaxID=1737472 RepID=A0ABX0K041_9PROT|nr:hypothetical protein [Acetobacter conturbans]NHN89087.1 hypothetical protein [Acetobacter conturbans]